LRTLGYGDDDIKGVLGANLLRVAEQVWPCA
jgi:microsomal dipeptidase-like Zn-dependent dipeptidase